MPVLWLDQLQRRWFLDMTGHSEALVSNGSALPRIPAPEPRFRGRYPATPLCVRVIRAEVEAVAAECGLHGEALHNVVLAVSEAATNAVVHGSAGREDAHIDLVVELTELELLVTVGDSGKGLRPSALPAGLHAGLAIIAIITGHLHLRSSDTGTEVHMAFLRSGEVVDMADGMRQLEDAASQEREGAAQRLDIALAEQDRLGERLDDAVGTSAELRAYARLQAAGEEVAARQAWFDWIETASDGGARTQLAQFELAN